MSLSEVLLNDDKIGNEIFQCRLSTDHKMHATVANVLQKQE